MIKIFNHYLHRQTLLRILSDTGLLVLVMLIAVASQGDSLGGLLPVAAPQAMSLAAGLFVINTATGFYQKSAKFTHVQVCARAALALVLLLPLSYLILGLLPADLDSREALRLAAMVGVSAVVLRRGYLSHWSSSAQSRTRILVFGSGAAALLVGKTLRESDPHAEIVGYYPGPNETHCAITPSLTLPTDRSLVETARQLGVDEIVVALTERRSGSMPLRELLDCKLLGMRVYDVNTHFEKTLGQIRIGFANAGWMVFGDGFNQGFYRTAIKRLFDVVCASTLMVLSAPIMLMTALLIKVDSPGPVLYRQIRAGVNLEPFEVIKFRSMRVDAEGDGKPRWASEHDDRVTRLGRMLRRLRIDEYRSYCSFSTESSTVAPYW